MRDQRAEPALGPVAYPHRVSALPNPLAPISHHWLDSTHITYGVTTGAVYGKKWKAEASVAGRPAIKVGATTNGRNESPSGRPGASARQVER
jgi:hypothetical protein